MKKTVLALVGLALFANSSVNAQHWCGTDEVRRELIAKDPGYLEREAALEGDIRRLIAENAEMRDDHVIIRIPIVFHILHMNGTENISNERIQAQMETLNEDFRKLNSDITQVVTAFQGIAADTRIEFVLPTRDGFGNCTDGIDRIQTVQTLIGESTSKMNQWPRQKYLNVWVARQLSRPGLLGYALLPAGAEGFAQVLDGIMILESTVGVTDPYLGRTLTHEIGHYLNLQHTWGNTNEPGVACGDDGVEDTPVTKGEFPCTPVNQSADCNRQPFGNMVQYTFNDVTTGSGTTDPTPAPNAMDTINGVLRTGMSSFTAVGLGGNSTADGAFSFRNWSAGADDGEVDYANLQGDIDSGKYYQFVATPPISDNLTIESFTFSMNRSDNGPRTFAVRSSVDNFLANLPVVLANDTVLSVEADNVIFYRLDTTVQRTMITIDPVSNGYLNLMTPITFRIYAWNAEETEGSFEVDDVKVAGISGRFENVQNHMNYSNCPRMYTLGQMDRMRAALNTTTAERNNLWTEDNHIATGIAPGSEVTCAPVADFYARLTQSPSGTNYPFTPTTCTNANVLFFDNSSRALPTSWEWTFQDGNPATSTLRNPTVQFSSPGWKTVTLTASNSEGSSTKTNAYAVLVGNNSDAYQGLYGEGFEGNDIFPWFGGNYDLNHTSWQHHVGGGALGTNRCARLNSGSRNQLNILNPTNGLDIDDMISPLINLSSLSSATLSFWYSYSTQTTTLDNVTEELEVFSSTDCGRTWQSRASIMGAALVNGGTAQGPGPWTLRNITLPGSLLTQNVRFRFRFRSSDFSGDLFIDEINIGAPVGIEGIQPTSMVRVFPNPSNDHFNIHVTGMETLATEVQIQDLRGALVYANVFAPMGGHGIMISSRELRLAEGMYVLRVKNDHGSGAQKLIVGR